MKDYPKIKSLPCIRCGFEINQLNKEDVEMKPSQMFDSGNIGEIHCGYGSSMDGDIWLLAICDDCLREHGVKIGEYM